MTRNQRTWHYRLWMILGPVALIVLILALGVFLPIWDLGNAALGKK